LRALQHLPDLTLEQRQFPRIEMLGAVVFIDQVRQFGQIAICPGAGHRRGQVIDNDGVRPALRLRPFAGIIDDEGIDERQIAEKLIGEA
jgi:hypothetical protein